MTVADASGAAGTRNGGASTTFLAWCSRYVPVVFARMRKGLAMYRLPELLQVRTPPGTAAALHELAVAEGKRMAEIAREAIADRLAAGRRSAPVDAKEPV